MEYKVDYLWVSDHGVSMDGKNYIIALGSNKGDKKAQIEMAVERIKESVGELMAQSSLYETEPYGGVADGAFVNAAVVVRSTLEPHDVLQKLLHIESSMGRIRDKKWGNREIDLDIIFLIDQGVFTEVRSETLLVPHPEALKRDFVMAPALEAMSQLYPLKPVNYSLEP